MAKKGRDNRPPQQICPKCQGSTWEIKQEARMKNGKMVTERVQKPCSQCGGSGWANRGR